MKILEHGWQYFSPALTNLYWVILTNIQLLLLRCSIYYNSKGYIKKQQRDFPAGTVVKNPPANAGDMALSLGPGRSHMPRSS